MSAIRRILFQQYQIYRYAADRTKKYVTLTTKSRWRIFWEMQRWLLQEGEINSMYFAWGLNSAGACQAAYIGRKEFMKAKLLAEKKLKARNNVSKLDYDVLTKDKFVHSCFLNANRIPCLPHFGIIVNGMFISSGDHGIEFEDLLKKHGELFVKSIALEASEGILHCKYNASSVLINGKTASMVELSQLVSSGVWLVQPKILSHQRIRAVNDSALNTTRIVTILDGNSVRYLAGFQAFATGKASTDTWSSGSIYVGIDVDNECLKENGYYNLSDKSNSITRHHPDSGVSFNGYHMPFLKAAVNLCIDAHKLMYNNFVIGWDVAITDEGPLIVEANEKPGMNVVQCADGGIRDKVNQAVLDIEQLKK